LNKKPKSLRIQFRQNLCKIFYNRETRADDRRLDFYISHRHTLTRETNLFVWVCVGLWLLKKLYLRASAVKKIVIFLPAAPKLLGVGW
jgi:hypothetical protein